MGAEQSQISSDSDPTEGTVNSVTFRINGKVYKINPEYDQISPDSRLVDFIRDKAGLTGTKVMCREGGCGCCLVLVKNQDASSGKIVTRALNSCLIQIFSCDGWDIFTIESLGNKKDGYNPIQKLMVKFGATQCGFCSPGMVLNMQGLIESKKNIKKKDIDKTFDGNICRCTGYRPILDAFKSMACDASKYSNCTKLNSCDIEEIHNFISKFKNSEDDDLEILPRQLYFKSISTGESWARPVSLESLFKVIESCISHGQTYKIVAGNTGTGVFKKDSGPYEMYIDIKEVPELAKSIIDKDKINLGATLSLNNAIEILKKGENDFEYAKIISKHMKRVANQPVRNSATIAGNLMLKHNHKEFPSDLFILFETVGVQICIATSAIDRKLMSVSEFYNFDMKNSVIYSINLKPISNSGLIFRSFKISKRYQNNHAFVNAGFLFKVDESKNFTVKEKPTIVYGGISPNFVHATNTENYLTGKSIKNQTILKGALAELDKELLPDNVLPNASPEYRKLLGNSLLYKFILGIIKNSAGSKYRSGGDSIKYNESTGSQIFDSDQKDWPINKAIPKLESEAQCSGEAEYIGDIPLSNRHLIGVFVVSNVASADIKSIDATDALNIPGVVDFIQATDIPGTNNYMAFGSTPEEIFASKKIFHHSQPFGLIVAENREIAEKAALKVKIDYENIKKPVLSMKDAIMNGNEGVNLPEISNETVLGNKTVKGEFQIGGQYHFSMETHITVCVPKEDDQMDVFPSTQHMDNVQKAISDVLSTPLNSINIQVRRLGGSYGSKISRAAQISCASAVAARKTNRSVKVSLDLQTNMQMMGKRTPYMANYEVTFDEITGKIQKLNVEVATDCGIVDNEETGNDCLSYIQSCYKANGWTVKPGRVLTNTPSNTWCRAPATTQGIAIIEYIMEHIAFSIKKDSMDVKLANFIADGDSLLTPYTEQKTFKGENLIHKLLEELKKSSEIDKRKIDVANFNKANRWRKRGLGIVPIRYPLIGYGDAANNFPAFVSIYKHDGTVVVCCGGIESGQGLNTKVAQAVAYELKVPIELVKVKPSNNLIAANGGCTGGSLTSELCCFAALKACQILNERMKPIKDRMKDPDWKMLVKLCAKYNIDLKATYMYSPKDALKSYDIWGLNLTEVEIDCLTGEHKIVRVDMIEDAGKSLNPEIDCGQIEGALTMGIGLWTLEKLIYDPNNGELLTNGTWDYTVPTPRSIPQDFRITLLKNAPNPFGILRSKATGEPPLCTSVSVLFALRSAIQEARFDAGNKEWFQINGPTTPDDVLMLCLTKPDQFIFS